MSLSLRHRTNLASGGAILSSLAAIGCCLPPTLLAGVGLAALASIPTAVQPWLLVISAGLLLAGVIAAVRGARCGTKPGVWNWLLLSVAALLVVLVTLFPQVVAGFVADFFY